MVARLWKNDDGRIIGRQLLKSATSIGANMHEAQGAQSKADFITKISIAHKEAYETSYWFKILQKSQLIKEEYLDEVIGALRISYERSVSRNGFFWWIQNVCIDKNYRGNGIFQRLHDQVINLAKKNEQVVAIKLHVHTNNRSAIKAYEKAGMKKTPEHPYIFNLK